MAHITHAWSRSKIAHLPRSFPYAPLLSLPHSEISHVLIFYMKDEFCPDLFEGAIEFGFVIL